MSKAFCFFSYLLRCVSLKSFFLLTIKQASEVAPAEVLAATISRGVLWLLFASRAFQEALLLPARRIAHWFRSHRLESVSSLEQLHLTMHSFLPATIPRCQGKVSSALSRYMQNGCYSSYLKNDINLELVLERYLCFIDQS